LGCLPDECDNIRRQQSIEAEETQLLPSADDGLCYPLGSSCPNDSSAIFDYDIFKMRPTCRVIKSSAANDDEADLDEIYNQLYPEYDFYRLILTYNNNRRNKLNRRLTGGELNYRRKLGIIQRKQGGSLTSGVFQVPSSLPDPLLNSCRPGAKKDNNFKCTNSAA
jgi:hypothetical protein